MIEKKLGFSKIYIIEKEGDVTKPVGSSEDEQIVDNYHGTVANFLLYNRERKTLMIKNENRTKHVVLFMFLSLFFTLFTSNFCMRVIIFHFRAFNGPNEIYT